MPGGVAREEVVMVTEGSWPGDRPIVRSSDTALHCVECGQGAREDARGWKAYLTIDDEGAVFCPSCARREFEADAGCNRA